MTRAKSNAAIKETYSRTSYLQRLVNLKLGMGSPEYAQKMREIENWLMSIRTTAKKR